jgi:hypothetical protein
VAENGEVEDDHERWHLNHPDVGSNGRLRRRISDGPGEGRCRRRQQVRRAWGRGRGRVNGLPGMMAAPTEGSAWPGTMSRVLCAEASQPAWCVAAPAAQASPVLRAFLGARPVEPCLRLLKEREKARSRHTEKKTKTEVSSDTYSLRTKANRACGEAPRASVPIGAAEGCPAADFGTASASAA